MSIKSIMTALANTVRSKTGVTGPLDLQGMANALASSWIEITPGLIDRSVTTYTIPPGVTSIAYSAFGYCTNLTSVTIPPSVTNIGMQAFEFCGLTSVTIPSSVTSIGTSAFYGCTSLTDIYCGFAKLSIPLAPWGATNVTVHYTDATVYYVSQGRYYDI